MQNGIRLIFAFFIYHLKSLPPSLSLAHAVGNRPL
jgi:hypothetical protein